MIYLVGFRATGKSTIGRLAARELGLDFVDLDKLLCEEAGKSVKEIVAEEGWPGFRGREKNMLLRSTYMQGSIVATGGGAVVHQDIWPIVKRGAIVVWLDASENAVYKRLLRRKYDDGRPALTEQELKVEIAQVMAERRPLYEAVSDIRISTESGSIVKVIDELIEQISIFTSNDLE